MVDRTAEFFEVLSTFDGAPALPHSSPNSLGSSSLGEKRPGSGVSVGMAGRFVRAGPVKAKPSKFSAGASDVSYRVQRTAAKLQELTRLIKSSDMFGDKTVQINQLSLSIKGEMTDLKNDLDKLAHMVGAQRVGGDGHSGASGSSQQGTVHSQRMVDSLKLQLGQTTRNFQSVLQTRASRLRQQQDRRAALGYTDNSSTILSRPLAFGGHSSADFQTQMQGSRTMGQVANRAGIGRVPGASGLGGVDRGPNRINTIADNPGAPGSVGRFNIGGGGDGNLHSTTLQLSESQLVDRNLDYLESRADAVQTINQTMGSLNTVFSDLLQLIDIQGSAVERIDDNVTEMQDNLEAGIQQLEQSVSGASNLRLMAKMFGVTIVFLIFFIIFLA